jgi:PilZ domain-containing protein
MDEARQSPRRRVLKSGSIRFGDVAISCVLRNLSPAGVALDIGSHVGIPDQFTLIVHAENTIHSCAVVWREEKRIGVAFY